MVTRYPGGLVIEQKDGILIAGWLKNCKNMKVGKFINQEMALVECENGTEVGGSRTVEELYADGYKDVCEVERPSEDSVESWQEYETCFIQVWNEPETEPDPDEISDSEALSIITQGE